MKKLITFCIVIWAFVFILFGLLIYRAGQINDYKEEIQIEKVEVVANPIITKSIEITKKSLAEEISEAVLKASNKHNIPAYVIYAIIATESGKTNTNDFNSENILDVNPSAKSSYNCIGLMQISKYALKEYNKFYKTNFSEDDLYNININIDIGTWHYKQFISITKNWVELYVIYNVGYTKYNKINPNWFYSWDGKWYCDCRNKFFYMNNVLPPTVSGINGMYGKKNGLPPYNAKKRFEKALAICKEYLEY